MDLEDELFGDDPTADYVPPAPREPERAYGVRSDTTQPF